MEAEPPAEPGEATERGLGLQERPRHTGRQSGRHPGREAGGGGNCRCRLLAAGVQTGVSITNTFLHIPPNISKTLFPDDPLSKAIKVPKKFGRLTAFVRVCILTILSFSEPCALTDHHTTTWYQSDTLVITGGYNEDLGEISARVTRFGHLGKLEELPSLNVARWGHGCASYKDGSKTVKLFVDF